ncbi:MAG: aldehyde dehydrogenase (NADP(+)) [Candidatus Acidiferrales bacterium]
MQIDGGSILGAETSKSGAVTFLAHDPASGRALDPVFHEATDAEAAKAVELAAEAFLSYRKKSPDAVAHFLEAIADGLERLGAELIARANSETALPEPRLISERGRTTGQLRMFAALVREGSWVDARIDRADPARKPSPKPDLRRMLVPLGPVVVFGASNFPLAYSVCGGDTASALAAGNPVVVKGHPAHPGTSELTARVVQQAVRSCGMPAGVFSMLQGARPELSIALVRHPLAKAVGFTGSLQAGRALFDAAASRPSPIPVFAEMGSLNPVFVLPGALKAHAAEIAESLSKSVTSGVGQFCTKPGQIAGLRSPAFEAFVERLGALVSSAPVGTMLHAGIAERYRAGFSERSGSRGVHLAADAPPTPRGTTETLVPSAVFVTGAQSFLDDSKLREELFGPATLATVCDSREDLESVARKLAGQLTVTIHASEDDLREYASLLDILREKAGRLIFGGVPTGVEVVPAMQHGGPYPATTDSRFTSVGTAAILRFVRPVCYQNFPHEWLPAELKNENPRGILRLVDGKWTRAPFADPS